MPEVSVSCSFDSSGGTYPNGYCVYLYNGTPEPELISCHCKEGFGPPADPNPDDDPPYQPYYYAVDCE